MPFETFESIRKQNSNCLSDIFKVKELHYAAKMLMWRNQKGKRLHLVSESVSYLGAKLWIDNPVHIGKLSDVDDHICMMIWCKCQTS